MIRKLRDNLTYANVMVTVLAFIVLGGATAYAAFRVPPNSVGSRQLKAKAVTGGKIADGTISGGKIEAESITGANIKMSALGVVPQAANATNAANANAVGGHSASCPAGTTLIRGLCFDTHSNPPVKGVEAAAEACAAKAGYLPTPMELYSAKSILNLGNNTSAAQHQFTDSLYGTVGGGSLEKTVVLDGVGAPEEYDANGESAYYCVYPLVR